MLKIYTVLCRAGTMDNYAYILVDEDTRTTAVVDPSENGPIIAKLNELKLTPEYIFNTHHHLTTQTETLSLNSCTEPKSSAIRLTRLVFRDLTLALFPAKLFHSEKPLPK